MSAGGISRHAVDLAKRSLLADKGLKGVFEPEIDAGALLIHEHGGIGYICFEIMASFLVRSWPQTGYRRSTVIGPDWTYPFSCCISCL